MAYYDFIMNQWVMNKLTPTQLQNAVIKGYITQEQSDVILAMPKSA